MSWAMSIVGSVAATQAMVEAGRQFIKGKKADANQQRMVAMQIAQMQQQMQKIDDLIASVPVQTKEFIKSIMASYTQLSAFIDEAQQQGDDKREEIFAAQRDMVEAHLTAELEVVDVNKREVIENITRFKDEALAITEKNEVVKDAIRSEYKREADVAVSNTRKMAEFADNRLTQIMKTGTTPEAAATLSKMQQRFADIKRTTSELESAKSVRGSASRETAVELEGLKILGETSIALVQEARQELIGSGAAQEQLEGLARNRADMLQPTRGEALLRTLQPYQDAELDTVRKAGDRSLTALSSANVKTRQLTQAEGEASLASLDAYNRDRMSLITNQQAAIQATKERGQELTIDLTTGRAREATSIADILGAQAQNYANEAAAARKAANESLLASGEAAGFAAGGDFSSVGMGGGKKDAPAGGGAKDYSGAV